jgi:hemerythrin
MNRAVSNPNAGGDVSIVWSEQYSVGVERIDAQHKQIIDMVNLLHDALAKKDASAEIKQVLVSLVDYTQTHFVAEEKLMISVGYPAVDVHLQKHAKLTSDLHGVLVRLRQGENISARRLFGLLRNWWTTHIERDDMQYGEWIRRLRESGRLGDLDEVFESVHR